MKKIIFTLMAFGAIAAANAQETYLNANLLKPELTGTARYVGMGGAMEALGADISTISSNPAGIGMFRHSTANVSFGVITQQDAPSIDNWNKTHMSFDQAGFVYSMRTGRSSFLNVAFNYTKERDFNLITNPSGSTNGGSQNLVTANKGYNNVFDLDPNTSDITSKSLKFTQLDYLYSNLMNYGVDDDGGYWTYYPMAAYDMRQHQTGYVGRYDFNVSGNINDRVYLGLTIGVHDVHFNSVLDYAELGQNGFDMINTIEENRITGSGFDFKAGIIFRPVEESPFRIGFAVATPTFYDLKINNYTQLNYEIEDAKDNTVVYSDNGYVEYDHDFRLNSPWKFSASIGHTIGNYLALGASYEYAHYGKTDTRYIDGYDYYGYATSTSDHQMNHHTENTLQAVSTLKLGAEMKPEDNLAVRLGFNYVSPMYKDNAVKDGDVNSVGNALTGTAFTNWDATYRITAGVGYRFDRFNVDIAYQYSTTDGTFSPYFDWNDKDYPNAPQTCKVSDKRHQLMMTLGYTF